MIKASNIIRLLEEWKTVHNYRLEVLINPSSWREAASDLRRELRNAKLDATARGIRAADDFASLLRFSYFPETEEIKIWVAFYANHDQIVPEWVDDDVWNGWIDIDHRKVSGVYPEYLDGDLLNP